MDYTQASNELIQKLKDNDLSQFESFLLIILASLPLPYEWRESLIVFFLNPHSIFSGIQIPHLTPLQFGILGLLLMLLSPLIGFLLLFLIYVISNFILKTLLPTIFGKSIERFIPKQENVFLEINFPVKTSQSSYSTEQLFALIHALASRQRSFIKGLIGIKKTYSLEIASSRDEGIKFYLSAPPKDAEILKGGLLSYLPGIKVKLVDDYLNRTSKSKASEYFLSLFDLKLLNSFPHPLKKQKLLEEHDPIAFLTGMMTKLSSGELISFQIITTPVLNTTHGMIINKIKKIKERIRKGKPISPLLNESIFQKLADLPGSNVLIFVFKIIAGVLGFVLKIIITIPLAIFGDSKQPLPILMSDEVKVNIQEILNPYEKQLSEEVKEKIDQHLFETTIRVLIMVKDDEDLDRRVDGIASSFSSFDSTYQSIITKGSFLGFIPMPPRLVAMGIQKHYSQFKYRSLSSNGLFSKNPILSTSEISDIYHLPYTYTTKTEGLVKDKSQELSLPLSQKKSSTKFDIVLGTNSYGGEILPLGLSSTERRQHTYIVGKTGQGKTNLISQMAYQDMVSGKGIAIIDPHGDMIEHLLTIIPKKRIRDVIYIDPSDKDFPVGLNMLLPNTKFKDSDDAVDNITKSVMSVFQKITPKEHWGQRMEHILRNAILTSLEVDPKSISTPYRSLVIIQKLLTDSNYLERITRNLSDPILKQFWVKEFSMFGNMQMASVISPLTNKLGEFITSKQSRNILLQEKSTINIQNIMNEGKILLVNLSKGKLGEERSNFFGTLIISLIQLAIYSRAEIPENKRREFFVYIDEFQNFATEHFTSLFSESRKYKAFFIAAHQNIAQIDDPKLAKVVLSNSGNIIAFKNGPDDEQILLPFLEPEVEKGQIVNLPPHHFFIKITNDDNEDAFSGTTQLLDVRRSEKLAKEIIANSRKHYATKKDTVEKQLLKLFDETTTVSSNRKPKSNLKSKRKKL